VRGVSVLAVSACLAAWSVPAAAQQSVDYASVSGRVTDPTGAVVSGAQVSARHTDTNVTAAAVTDGNGRFRFPYLKVGPYEIAVRQQGFTAVSRTLTLTVGAAYELPVRLAVGAMEDTVTVTGEANVLEAARSQIAGTVSQAEVQALPLNGRNFLDLALLVPGVSPTNVGGTQLYPETSAVPGPGLSVGSQRNLSNNFIVDGLSANDDAAALSGITYSVDAVAEFQVVTSGGQAELGRALGGYVNVITKSGTNTYHGDVYGYFRDEGLNAANALSGTRLPMTQAQFGLSHGGPIVRDRTFYFVNVERRNLDQTGLVTISPANVDAVNARLDAVSYPGPRIRTGQFPITIDTTNVLAKVDHQLGAKDRLSVRYSLYDLGAENARNAGGLNAVTTSTGLDNLDQTFAVSNVFMVSSRTVLETRAQFAHSDFGAPPTDPVGPAVSIAGVASFGTSSGNPTGRLNKMYQVVNNLSHQAGPHALRLGADFLYNDDVVTYPRAFRGSYAFSSLATFRTGVYNNGGFTQTFRTSVISQGNANLGFYAQDEWKVSPRLTLNAGLRYDLQFLESIETDRNNVSPRLGFAWTPTASRRTVVRGGAGLFFDRVPLRPLANALLSAQNTTDLGRLSQIGVGLSPTQAGAPVFPNILGEIVPTTTLVNFTTMDRDLQNAYSRQASLEVEHQLGERATVSLGYQYLSGRSLILQVNQNVPSCVASGSNNGCRPNPAYANNNQYSSLGESNYHGLHVSFVQRPARWGQYRISYTLSKSMNNVGEAFFNSPIDPFDLSKDWARSDDDQRHRLVVNGTASTPTGPARTAWERISHGFQLSAMLQYYSALPFNITSGVTTVQGTAGRPIVNGEFIERNAGVGSDFFSLNARLTRAFRVSERVQLEGMAEGFNLTNRRNILTRNTNFGAGAFPTSPSPTFGQITALGEPRTFQLGLRVRF
jgi:outer membrane receptor protein involved in Fe transport